MKLKRNLFVAAALIAGSASSFAAGILCETTSSLKFVTTCTPEVTYFIAGSSALGGSVEKIIKTYFDTTTMYPVKVVDNNTTFGSKVIAYYGMSIPTLTTTSKRMYIVYNSYNGSAAGVSNVLADSKLISPVTVPESQVALVGPYSLDKGKNYSAAICESNSASTALAPMVTCSSASPRNVSTQADVGLSDVKANELVSLYYDAIKGGAAKASSVIANFNQQKIAMQGFSVAVNDKLYDAMAKAQFGDACVGVYTLACQPNITSAQYASLVTREGSIKSAAALVGDITLTGKLIVARRDQLSGTQATSNLFFAGNTCNAVNPDVKTGKLGGALTVLRTETAAPGYTPSATDTLASAELALMSVKEFPQTGDLQNLLRTNTTDYVIGVVATDASESASSLGTTKIKLLKLNGSSPDFAKGSTSTTPALTGAALSTNIIDGSYPLQMTAYAVYPKTQTGDKAKITTALLSDLSKFNSLKPLPLGFFSGSNQTTTVSRYEGNNCSPLIQRAN
jgi:hypothetical protein